MLHRIMALAVIRLLHHCHSSFHPCLAGLLLLQEVWQCCFLLSAGFKCPVCSKSVASNEMEVHFIMCLSKPRLSYNGKTVEPPTVPAHSYYRKLQRYQLSIFPLNYFPPFLSHCISLSFHSPFHSCLWLHSGAEKSLWTVDDPFI